MLLNGNIGYEKYKFVVLIVRTMIIYLLKNSVKIGNHI